jgi:hypothetical protein
MLGLQDLLAILEDLGPKDHLENPAHPVTPDQKDHQATTAHQVLLVNQATMERREHLATMAHPVYLEDLDYQAKTDTMELRDLQDLKAKPAHLDTLSHPRSQAHLVHLATPVKTENQDTMAVPALLVPLDLLDLKGLPANLAPMDILADRDLKETLELLAIAEHQARMDILVPQAKFLVLQDHLDLLVLLATTALLAKMVSLVVLDTQAKTDSPALLDILVYS